MKKCLFLLSLFLSIQTAWSYDVEVDDIYFNLNKADKTATVTNNNETIGMWHAYSGDMVVPECILVSGVLYTVTTLGEGCFALSNNLTSVSLPNTITTLETACFEKCPALTSITLPQSVLNIGDRCFHGCIGLTTISIPDRVTSLGDYCFFNCTGLTSITLPKSLLSLGDYCLSGCTALASISLPSSVTTLGDLCFAGDSSLTSVIIPESVTSLGVQCFTHCLNLASVSLPQSITSLGAGCFNSCYSLTSITIPSSVRSLGDYCFSACFNLSSITMLPATPPTIGEMSLFDTALKTIYVVSEDVKALYQSTSPWNEYEIVVMSTGIEEAQHEKDAPRVTNCYNLSGKKLDGKHSGPVIMRYADGSTRKVIVK